MKPSNRKKRRRRKFNAALFLGLVLCIFLFCALSYLCIEKIQQDRLKPKKEAEVSQETEETVPDENTEETSDEETSLITSVDLTEEDIYSFLQGPKGWEAKVDWSGSWCAEALAGQLFSVFGCGLCDLANIYSTLTSCDCSPVDMFYYAQEASSYAPVSGYGAIDWPDLQKTLESVGISCELHRKDDSYEEFQQQIASAITAIVLVSSYDDNTYWPDTSGHYVNIWLYQPEDDTVFLADSGNPAHNRQRIPLSYVYSALASSSSYQYLLVKAIDPDGNSWGHDGIEAEWKVPAYYK